MSSKLSARNRERLIRILRLLGSDQPGERASAALSAHRMIDSLDTDWEAVLGGDEARVVRVRDWDLDQHAAAQSRIRQLKAQVERQERQIKSLRTRVNTLAERERQSKYAGGSGDGEPS